MSDAATVQGINGCVPKITYILLIIRVRKIRNFKWIGQCELILKDTHLKVGAGILIQPMKTHVCILAAVDQFRLTGLMLSPSEPEYLTLGIDVVGKPLSQAGSGSYRIPNHRYWLWTQSVFQNDLGLSWYILICRHSITFYGYDTWRHIQASLRF